MYLGKIVEIGGWKEVYNSPTIRTRSRFCPRRRLPDPEKQRARDRIVLQAMCPAR